MFDNLLVPRHLSTGGLCVPNPFIPTWAGFILDISALAAWLELLFSPASCGRLGGTRNLAIVHIAGALERAFPRKRLARGRAGCDLIMSS